MENIIIYIAVGVIAGVLGFFLRQIVAKRRQDSLEARLERTQKKAKEEAEEHVLKAKKEAVSILEEAKKQEEERQKRLNKIEELLIKREEGLDERLKEIEQKEKKTEEEKKEAEKIRNELEDIREKKVKELEAVATLSKDEAKEQLLKSIEEEYEEDLEKRIHHLENEGREKLEKRAQELLTTSLQRYSNSMISEITTTYVDLPKEDLKGRIIGKEGRNIKTLERLTGVDIVVDETPDSVMLSSFDPIRRQVARVALEALIKDGRIQPARIEEKVKEARQTINEKVKEAGEAAVYDVGVSGLDSRLVQLLGRLRYRTSYGQNVLLHSIEAAHIAGMIAHELGANVQVAKKGALFHDVGKAIDHEVQGTHVEIGIKILEKFGASQEVIDAMKSHHDDYPHESLEAIIVQVAESISAARPGARKDTVEAYLKRLDDIENTASSFEGVEKAYAIQAGREVRVFVRPGEVNDAQMHMLAKDIARRLESELSYPGEIKVNVIRENRVVEYAK